MLLLAVVNLNAYADQRGTDAVAFANIKRVEAVAPQPRTVFLVHGFEAMTTWLTVAWGRGTSWPNSDDSLHPRGFNAIYIASEATEFPQRSAAEAASDIVVQVEKAIAQGRTVIASGIWAASSEDWVDSMSTVSEPDKPLAMRAALHETFSGTPIGTVDGWGTLYRIYRKQK
jgi:hypothetical protein